jgi:hypothetical protein
MDARSLGFVALDPLVWLVQAGAAKNSTSTLSIQE